jgi:hypothetical protein
MRAILAASFMVISSCGSDRGGAFGRAAVVGCPAANGPGVPGFQPSMAAALGQVKFSFLI